MNDGKFEWDDQKASSNYAKHGVSFDSARAVFTDAFALEWSDNSQDYGEERYAIIGMAHGRLMFVAYTMRGDAIRIISARAAEPYENRKYYDSDA